MSKSSIYHHLLRRHLSGSARYEGKNVIHSLINTAKPNVGTLGTVELPVNALTASIKLVLGDDSVEKYVPPVRNGEVRVPLEHLHHFKFSELPLLDPNFDIPPSLFNEYDEYEAFHVDLDFSQKFGTGVRQLRNSFYSDTLRKRTLDSWAMIPFEVIKL